MDQLNLGFIVLVLGIIGVAWAILTYNRLVRLRVRADEAWHGIDTQLKRRWDLLPQLVTTVQGYASHERDVFERVASARQRSMQTETPRDQAYAEESLKEELRSLYALVEDYPDLRADKAFLKLGETLEEIEDTIQRSRRYYNSVVRDLNTMIGSFPRKVIANAFHFKEREYYALRHEEEAISQAVKF